MEPVKWQGGGGWAWTGGRKILLSMAGAGGGGGKCERVGVWAVRVAGLSP